MSSLYPALPPSLPLPLLVFSAAVLARVICPAVLEGSRPRTALLALLPFGDGCHQCSALWAAELNSRSVYGYIMHLVLSFRDVAHACLLLITTYLVARVHRSFIVIADLAGRVCKAFTVLGFLQPLCLGSRALHRAPPPRPGAEVLSAAGPPAAMESRASYFLPP